MPGARGRRRRRAIRSDARKSSQESAGHTVWATWVLALACVGGLLWAQSSAREAEALLDAELSEAQAYFESHPYLELAPLLEERVGAADAERRRQTFETARRGRGAPPIPARIKQRHQNDLDAMLAEADAQLEGLVTRRLGVRPAAPAAAAFVGHWLFHVGWLHLLTSLGVVVWLGVLVEGAWGSLVGLAVVASGALGGAAAYVVGNPGAAEPWVGSTGIAAALLGAFWVLFRGGTAGVPLAPPTLLALVVLGVLPALGLDWAVVRGHAAAPPTLGGWNPSGWGLLGGLAAGAAVAAGLRALGVKHAGEAGAAPRRRARAAGPSLQRALAARDEGNLEDAYAQLQAAFRRDPSDLRVAESLWDAANALGRPRSASGAILRVVRDEVKRGDRAAAVRHWLELVATGLDVDAEPSLLIRMAAILRDAGEPGSATAALRTALQRSDPASGGALATRVAHAAADLDPEVAQAAAWRALGSADLDLQERQTLENLIAELMPVAPYTPEEEPVAEAPAPSEPEAAAPAPIEFSAEARQAEIAVGVPTELQAEGLVVEVAGAKKRVPYDRIEAVAVAAIGDLSDRTVIVVDLVLNWISLESEALRMIRLRSDRFDPRRLVDRTTGEPLDALRALVCRLLEESGALPLPDLQSAQGVPFAAFADLASYHRDVLMIDSA